MELYERVGGFAYPRLFTALEPRIPMQSIEDVISTYVPDMDHARAANDRNMDENGKTVAHALEWLLDSSVERLASSHDDANLQQTCKNVCEPHSPRSCLVCAMLTRPESNTGDFVKASSVHHSGSFVEVS